MVDYIPAEKGVVIRMPSVANLMVDSFDRKSSLTSAFDFQITKPQALQNGFFTRVAATEVTLNWFEPNISAALGNNTFIVGIVSTLTFYTVTFFDGNFTMAQALDWIATVLTATVPSVTFTIVQTGGARTDLTATANFTIVRTILSQAMGFATQDNTPALFKSIINAPDIRPYQYLDFVSDQLNYNQNVKDATTNNTDKNVLCRWYFSWDNPTFNDKYGFPILMGYTGFTCRRLFSPAKQIKWEPNMPIGNLSFQVFGFATTANFSRTTPLATSNRTNTGWQMTLQLSEV